MSTTPKNGLTDPQGIESLAREMAKATGLLVEDYRRDYKLRTEEAFQRATAVEEDRRKHLLEAPPAQLDWSDLENLASVDPDAMCQRWEEIQKTALDELQSGHRAALSVEAGFPRSSPLDRARFLAIRYELAVEWQPTNGIERQLIDQMAAAQTMMFYWMDSLTVHTASQAHTEKRDIQDSGRWQPARISEHDALNQSAEMADRFHKMFVRCLRALRDLRRYAPTVVVQNAEQVNVGNQQVNVSGKGRKKGKSRRSKGHKQSVSLTDGV